MFQGQIGETAPLSPGKLGLFLILALFSTRPSQNWALSPSYKLVFRINMEQGYPLKKFRLDKLKITVSISNCKKTVFNYAGNLMVTMVTKQKIFDQLYLL